MVKTTLPKIGLGTWQLKRTIAPEIVKKAIEIGYRLIDTAQIYGNEEEVGQGIQDSGIEREKIILATKVWISKLAPLKVISSTEESLKKLKTDYVDLS